MLLPTNNSSMTMLLSTNCTIHVDTDIKTVQTEYGTLCNPVTRFYTKHYDIDVLLKSKSILHIICICVFKCISLLQGSHISENEV